MGDQFKTPFSLEVENGVILLIGFETCLQQWTYCFCWEVGVPILIRDA